jgi:hypothetical protein
MRRTEGIVKKVTDRYSNHNNNNNNNNNNNIIYLNAYQQLFAYNNNNNNNNNHESLGDLGYNEIMDKSRDTSVDIVIGWTMQELQLYSRQGQGSFLFTTSRPPLLPIQLLYAM